MEREKLTKDETIKFLKAAGAIVAKSKDDDAIEILDAIQIAIQCVKQSEVNHSDLQMMT